MTTETRSGSTRGKGRKRALDILFEAELRDTDPIATLAERTQDAAPPVREFTRELVEGVTAHRSEIDDPVAITEAVELARTLSTDDSPRFLNGVLSRIADLAVYLRTTR